MGKYIINECMVLTEEEKTIKSYGITIKDTPETIYHDVSTEKCQLELLIDRLNEMDVDPVHMELILEDFLIALEV